ncbi:MAG: DUF86 domain-containing protein [Methylacidiphilales bacterium]|nr:DUF86 domain-containing protein [Candidatus Methylacidiphilales bacterium]
MPTDRPAVRFQDIIEAIDSIRTYVGGLEPADLVEHTLVFDGVAYCLLRISEAATKLGPAAEALAPDQPWPQIRTVGNWLRHRYDGVDIEIVRRIVWHDLDSLRVACARAVDALGAQG